MKVLTVARWYPSHDSPGRGSFVSDMVRATVEAGVDARVASFDRVRVPRSLARPEVVQAVAQSAYRKVVSPESLFLTPPSVGAPGVAVARIPLVTSAGDDDPAGLIAEHGYALRPFVRALSQTWRPDVIHAHTGLPDGIVAAEIGRELGIPVVVTEHASTIETTLADPVALERYRTLLEPDIRLLAVSPSTAARLAGLLGIEPHRIQVMANPIFEVSFPLADAAGRHPDELLYVGSLAAHKGIDVLLRALALLRADRPGLRLRVIGAEIKAGDREPLETLTAELGLAEVVDFEGWANREAIASAMASAAVLVHPSPSETFGVVAAEAILSGLPVASRRSGGVPWIIDLSGGYGAVATDDDDTAFASAIMSILDRPPAVDAATARSRLVERVGWSGIAAEALALYRSVANHGVGEIALAGSSAGHAAANRSGGMPTVLAARDRGNAQRAVARLAVGLRQHLVLIAPRPGPRAVVTSAQIKDAVRPGRFAEAGPVPARRRGWGPLARLQRAVLRPRPTTDDVLAAAILEVASAGQVGDEPVEVVALDAPAAAIVARLDPTRVRLAPGSIRWLADLWDTVPGQAPDLAPAIIKDMAYDPHEYWTSLHARGDLSTVGQSGLSSEINAWLYRGLEGNVRRFLRRQRVFDNVHTAFDVGAGSGYWVRVWHDLGATKVDGCDLVPDAVARLETTFAAQGDQFVTADIGAVEHGLPDRTYDFVSVMNVLLHVTEDAAFQRALANVAALVAPGGRLLLVEPILFDPAYERKATAKQQSRARPLAAYRDPLLAAGLEVVDVRGIVAMANNPIEAGSRKAYTRYQKWWRWVARTSKESPDKIRFIGPLMLALDRAALAAKAAPSSKVMLLQRPGAAR